VHLNLVEGRSLCGQEQVPLLLDSRGCFQRTFLSLWLLYNVRFKHRAQPIAQIERELDVQLRRVKAALPAKPIIVDSHQHLHLLPFLFRMLVRRAGSWGIKAIRIASGPFLLPPLTRQGLMSLFSTNVLKYLALQMFSRRCVHALRGSGIVHPDYLVSVLLSGKMSLQLVRRALRKVAWLNAAGDPEVELLFHPGPAQPREVAGWKANPRKKRFYVSSDRAFEMQALVSMEFRNYLSRVKEVRR
jgi:predicted glycoside hydrolase/deacetylase ChbG (UPF0249 family)